MRPYNQLSAKEKFIRKNLARVLLYGIIGLGFTYGVRKWIELVKQPQPVVKIFKV